MFKYLTLNKLSTMKKLISIFSLAIVVVLITGAAFEIQAQNEEEPSVTIVEYSDYQCPACAHFHPIVEKLKDKYGDQINVEMKYFPLNSHRYAAIAARAAQAAKNQDKFNEMNNLLFENQEQWSKSGNPGGIFVNYAEKIGLDVEQFKDELNASETQEIVMEERNEGRNKGVNSTPTFYIEGEQLNDLPRTFEQFDQIVQDYLQEKQSSG